MYVKQVGMREQVQENENSNVGGGKVCNNAIITYYLENIPNGNHSMTKRLGCIFSLKKNLYVFNELQMLT